MGSGLGAAGEGLKEEVAADRHSSWAPLAPRLQPWPPSTRDLRSPACDYGAGSTAQAPWQVRVPGNKSWSLGSAETRVRGRAQGAGAVLPRASPPRRSSSKHPKGWHGAHLVLPSSD